MAGASTEQRKENAVNVLSVELPPELAEHLARMEKKIDDLTALVGPKQSYLTAEQVAERMNVNTDTVRRWGREGRLPIAKRVGGGKMLFDPRDVSQAV
jgi:excisionase family DNA binding protein